MHLAIKKGCSLSVLARDAVSSLDRCEYLSRFDREEFLLSVISVLTSSYTEQEKREYVLGVFSRIEDRERSGKLAFDKGENERRLKEAV